MAVPDDVARLLAESLAAHTRRNQAANARAHAQMIREARAALASLRGALALDPGRTLPVWHGLPPRDTVAVSDAMVRFYERLDARGVVEGL
jgi:hypothetical protein